MANPVLSRPDAFAPAYAGQGTFNTVNPASPYAQPYAQPGQPGQPYAQPGYAQPGQPYAQPGQPYDPAYAQPGQPGAWQTPAAGYGQPVPPSNAPIARMTLDDVLTKTAIVLGIVVLIAGLSWRYLPWDLLMVATLVAGLVSFIVPLVAAFRRNIGPGIAITYALFEGVFLGGISKFFERYYEGIVLQAVIGTFMAAAITLAAFKFGKIRLSGKVRKILFISLIAYAGVALLSFVLSLFGIDLGFYAGMTGQVGWLAWAAALIGVVLAVVSLIDDFQFIEAGIQNGAPAKQSWVAAYGLSVTMVFLYLKILRILSYIRR